MFQMQRTTEHGFGSGAGGRGRHGSSTTHQLGNAGTGDAEDGDAVFTCPGGGDECVQLMLLNAPLDRIHRWNDQGLGSLFHQLIHHPRVAQVITDRDSAGRCEGGSG